MVFIECNIISPPPPSLFGIIWEHQLLNIRQICRHLKHPLMENRRWIIAIGDYYLYTVVVKPFAMTVQFVSNVVTRMFRSENFLHKIRYCFSFDNINLS